MRSDKQLELWIAEYLGWKRETKKHYGHSIHDLSGDGYKGDSKHYKKHRIHTIKKEMDMKYKDDMIIFTKEKRTHYESHNILASITLEVFNYLLECKRIAEKTPPLKVKTKTSNELIYKIRAIRQLFKDIEKLLKAKEEK